METKQILEENGSYAQVRGSIPLPWEFSKMRVWVLCLFEEGVNGVRRKFSRHISVKQLVDIFSLQILGVEGKICTSNAQAVIKYPQRPWQKILPIEWHGVLVWNQSFRISTAQSKGFWHWKHLIASNQAKVEPSNKTMELRREFSEQNTHRSYSYCWFDKAVSSVVIKYLAALKF